MAAACAILLLVIVAAAASINAEPMDFSGGDNGYYPASEFVDLMSRGMEALPGPAAFGHKFMSGGAGEGEQRLRPDDDFETRQQVKSDNVLPEYCQPPNPCPVGHSAEEGCLEEFDNTAEFSRNFQSQQQCICDHEHMFNCPSKNTNGGGSSDGGSSNGVGMNENLDEMLDKNGLHKSMVSKKFHEKRSDFEIPRRKRSAALDFGGSAHMSPNPYLAGEPLHSVSKKDGRNIY